MTRLASWRAARLGPAATAAIHAFRSPTMPAEADYALLTSARPSAKPWVFPDIDGLARRIHRDRRGEALDLRTTKINVPPFGIRRVIAVYGQDQVGGRTRFIGYAWARGQSREALEAALQAVEPSMAEAA